MPDLRHWTLPVAAAVLLAPIAAHAQASQCAMPQRLPAPRPDLPTKDQPKRVLPIGGYTLAISWSPHVCISSRHDESLRCSGRNGRFGFTLHGLWPDGEGRIWPQYCRPTRLLTQPVIRANLCATPSVQLLQHEWAKHGTCMTTRPADYFGKSRALFEALRYPDMAALGQRRDLRVADLQRAFARANRGMSADMLRVTTTRAGWLDEIWLCYDKRLRPARCPAHQGGAAPTARLRIEPMR